MCESLSRVVVWLCFHWNMKFLDHRCMHKILRGLWWDLHCKIGHLVVVRHCKFFRKFGFYSGEGFRRQLGQEWTMSLEGCFMALLSLEHEILRHKFLRGLMVLTLMQNWASSPMWNSICIRSWLWREIWSSPKNWVMKYLLRALSSHTIRCPDRCNFFSTGNITLLSV